MQRQLKEWEGISPKHTSDKASIVKICEELKNSSVVKTINYHIKMDKGSEYTFLNIRHRKG
jgi:hypothetical protein